MKLNFMLIDDNEIDLFVNQKYIEKAIGDAEILTFIRAKSALAHLNALIEHPEADHTFIPDFILVDINMPEMDGFEFLEAYSDLKCECLKNTKVYMVSSSTNLKDMLDAERHGACHGFISKPLTIGILQGILPDATMDAKR